MIDINYWPFFILAILGAIVANATGAGGGIVFVPAFNMLAIPAESIIATSFAIQCFGMTAGTLAWNTHRKHQVALLAKNQQTQLLEVWSRYFNSVLLFALPAIFGVVLGQTLFALETADLVKSVFKAFSFVFGLTILATTVLLLRSEQGNREAISFTKPLRMVAMIVGFVGGLITAWLSIGVGELVAVMLILMRYPVRMAIGVAVTVSAVCVWVGVQYYVWITQTINFNVLVFAAPAAAIGGTVAKRVVARFSAIQVKVFIAIWILISAVVM